MPALKPAAQWMPAGSPLRRFASDPVALARPLTAQQIEDCGTLRGLTRVFWQAVNPGADSRLVDGYHIACLCEHYEELLRPDGCLKNLCVEMPPRMGKSLLTNVMLFAYGWLKRPWLRFIYSSNAHSLVIRDSLYSRDVIKSAMYRSVAGNRVMLRTDQNTQKRFTNSQQGFRLSMTVGSGIGEGGDLLIADDSLDPRRARSAVAREALHHWWRNTFRHRMVNPATTRRLVIGARVGKADLSGFLRENEPDEWDYLTLPMEYEPHRMAYLLPPNRQPKNDPITATALQRLKPWLQDGPGGSGRRKNGDLLHEPRFDAKEVRSMKRGFGRDAPGQLAQRPQDEGGSIFRMDKAKQFKIKLDEHGRLESILLDHRIKGKAGWRVVAAKRWRWFQTIDTAQTANTTSDLTAIGTYGLSDAGDLIIWDVFAERLEIPDQFPTIQLLRRGPVVWTDGVGAMSGTPWPFDIALRYCENKSSGYGIIADSLLDGTPIQPLPEMPGDKIQRATRLATLYQSGKVYHPWGAALWLEQFEEEMRLFPNGTNDDRVDSAAYAGILVSIDTLLRQHLRRHVVKNRAQTADEQADARPSKIEAMLKEAGPVDPSSRTETLPDGVRRVILQEADPERGLDAVYHYVDDVNPDPAKRLPGAPRKKI